MVSYFVPHLLSWSQYHQRQWNKQRGILPRPSLWNTSARWRVGGLCVTWWQNTWGKQRKRRQDLFCIMVAEVFIFASGLGGLDHVVREHHSESTWWDEDAYFIVAAAKNREEGARISCVLQGCAPNNTPSSKTTHHPQLRTTLAAHELFGDISNWTPRKQAMNTW